MSDYTKAIWKESPNKWVGREGHTIQYIVLHGTAGSNPVTNGWFLDTKSQVSAHYVVDTDGTVYQCVREDDSAWANGVVTPNSKFYGLPNMNYSTISIEHVRDQTNSSPITQAQLAASLDLCKDILRRRGVLQFLAHDEIEVGRVCPGPNFPLYAFFSLEHLDIEDEAHAYYTQGGVTINEQHAIWSDALMPIYALWHLLSNGTLDVGPLFSKYYPEIDWLADVDSRRLADLIKPGVLLRGEAVAKRQDNLPAVDVRLQNRIVGVYRDANGEWQPYQGYI